MDLAPTEFYATASRCKPCVRSAVRANRAKRREYYVAYDRARAMTPKRIKERKAYAQSDHGRPIIRAIKERWAERNAFKRVAEWTASNAVRDGRLERKPCIVCGKKAQAHHPDYTKPLDVVWLCPKHHKAEHRRMKGL